MNKNLPQSPVFNNNNNNRGTHGVSSSMLGTLVSSSENPPCFSRGECQWRQKYIDMLVKYDDNICSKCMHDYQKICKGSKECDGYVEGNEGFIGDEKVRFPWTCLDFCIGDCSMLEGTPCHGCVDANSKNYFSHFELNEAMISDGE